jgi:hypothetical protein
MLDGHDVMVSATVVNGTGEPRIHAALIGVYQPTGNLHNGKQLFRMRKASPSEPDRWLRFKKDNDWVFSGKEEKDGKKITNGMCISMQRGMDHPTQVDGWKFDTDQDPSKSEWEINVFLAPPGISKVLSTRTSPAPPRIKKGDRVCALNDLKRTGTVVVVEDDYSGSRYKVRWDNNAEISGWLYASDIQLSGSNQANQVDASFTFSIKLGQSNITVCSKFPLCTCSRGCSDAIKKCEYVRLISSTGSIRSVTLLPKNYQYYLAGLPRELHQLFLEEDPLITADKAIREEELWLDERTKQAQEHFKSGAHAFLASRGKSRIKKGDRVYALNDKWTGTVVVEDNYSVKPYKVRLDNNTEISGWLHPNDIQIHVGMHQAWDQWSKKSLEIIFENMGTSKMLSATDDRNFVPSRTGYPEEYKQRPVLAIRPGEIWDENMLRNPAHDGGCSACYGCQSGCESCQRGLPFHVAEALCDRIRETLPGALQVLDERQKAYEESAQAFDKFKSILAHTFSSTTECEGQLSAAKKELASSS